ncbi:Arylsulfatase [Pseudomonas marincola]|uniref:Arylsulfatase n=1 Tax=Pseudomonas marincola TaxID=437900 RepID=A0A653E7U6_9PSED|nr:arylsulfatase [Pseudomonas marincola]CAE6915649.1 Arylsulfatase [Pseudomonas marincola]
MRINRLTQALLFGLLAASNAAAATSSQPNILLILADDLGYSDLGAFGGEINTPQLDTLAKANLQLTSMYAAPTCSPTRSMLMSGTDHHLAGLGTMAEALMPFQKGHPGYEGYLNQQVYSMPQLLQNGGYDTMMVGKWHLGLTPEQGPAARGFQQSFSMLEGGASHFKPRADEPSKIEQVHYVENGKAVEVPDDFYSTDFYTDKLISYMKNTRKDGKPFFAYAAYTAPHWPLQAPDAYLDKYKGRYDKGYDSVRTARIEQMKKLGLLPADFTAARPIPANPHLPGWEQLTPEQQQAEARKMEIYAAMVDNLDHNIGRLLDYLRESGQYDNTLIVFMSDNGAAGENHSQWYPNGKHTDNSLANLGRINSEVDYGVRWAEVSAAPFHLFKSTTAEGGISVPAIVKMPKAMARQGRLSEVARVDDLLPTFLAVAGLPLPAADADKHAITGKSMLAMLSGKQEQAQQPVLAGELFGNAYYREGNMKLLGMRPRAGFGDAPQPPKWTLYDLSKDRGETNDLAAAQPEQVKRMQQAWGAYTKQVGVVFPPAAQAKAD